MSATKKRKKSRASGVSALYPQLAKKVVTESLYLRPGDSVTVETWNNGLEFAKEIVKEARKVGALPLLILEDDGAYLWGLQNTPKEFLGKMGKHEYGLLSSTDAYVFVPGPLIGTYTPSVPREEGSMASSYNSSWYEAAEKARVRGVRLTFGYVGEDLAKLLGKKREDIVLRQLKASLVSSDSIKQVGKPILERLTDGTQAELRTGNASLSFNLRGDLGIEDGVTDEADITAKNGISYIVPGLIWKEVDPESTTGKVVFSSSVTRLGLINGGTLEFEKGRLTGWEGKDKQGQQKLDKILGEMTEEKRKLSMITIGLNPVLTYGYGQDRFVAGAIGLGGFGITGVVDRGTLNLGMQPVIEKGKLVTAKASIG